jgi:hypothetical protein
VTDEEPDAAPAAYAERLVGRSGAGWKRLRGIHVPHFSPRFTDRLVTRNEYVTVARNP